MLVVMVSEVVSEAGEGEEGRGAAGRVTPLASSDGHG